MILDLTIEEYFQITMTRRFEEHKKHCIADDLMLSGSNIEEHRANVARLRALGYGKNNAIPPKNPPLE